MIIFNFGSYTPDLSPIISDLFNFRRLIQGLSTIIYVTLSFGRFTSYLSTIIYVLFNFRRLTRKEGVEVETKIKFKLQGKSIIEEASINKKGNKILIQGSNYEVNQLPWDVPISGTIFGTLLNYKGALEAMGDELNHSPYQSPPKAPILYIKPVNTMTSFNTPIPLPTDIPELEVGAALGIVIGRPATKVKEDQAFNYIAGYTIVNDISIPHRSVYRPAITEKARDGFCPIGPWIVEKGAHINPDNLTIKVFVNEVLRQENTTANLIRPVSKLLQDITEFMTLYPGDTVLVGIPENPPFVRDGDRIRIEIEQIGNLENTVVHEKNAALGVSI